MTNQEKYVNALRKITGNTNPEMHNGDLYVDAFAAIADGEGGGGGTGSFYVPLTFVREEDDTYIFTSTVSPGTIVEKYGNKIPVYLYGEFDGNPVALPVVTAHGYAIGDYEIVGNHVIAQDGGAIIIPQIVYDNHSDEYVLSMIEFVIPDIPEIPDPDDADEPGMALMSNKTNKYVFGWPIKVVNVKGAMTGEDIMAINNTDDTPVTASSLSTWVNQHAILKVTVTIDENTTVVYDITGITAAEITEIEGGITTTTMVFDILADGHIFETDNLLGNAQVVFKRK